jgi:uncharacterized membrane protein
MKDPIDKPFPHNILKREKNTDSIKDFVKAIRSWNPDAEFYTTKDSIVYESKDWKIEYFDGNKKEIDPYVPNKQMPDMRSNAKTKPATKFKAT